MNEPAPRCPNCGASASSPYCAQCGQRQGELRPSLRHVFDELVRYLLRIDGRLLSTLRGLLQPGFLTLEYLAGRRERYEKPLRLYIVTIALWVLVTPKNALLNIKVDGVRVTGDGPQPQLPANVMQTIDAITSHMQVLSLLFILYGTWVMTVVYRKRGVRFAEHFVFMLHFGSQANLLGVLTTPLRAFSFEVSQQVASALSGLVMLFAIKRVYAERWLTMLWRLLVGGAVGLAGLVVFALLGALGFMLLS